MADRQKRPGAPIVVSAAYVSQLTCTSLLGVDPRRYLEMVVPECRPDVVRVGKLRLVELARAVEALRAMASDDTPEPRSIDDEPAQPETADAVLASLGKELAT